MKKTHWFVGIFILAGLMLSVIVSSAAEVHNLYLPLAVKNWPPISTRPPTPVAGRVLFSEAMADPVGVEPDPEWFELHNDGGAVFDLSGYRVGDEETPGGSEGLLQFPAGALIQPGQVIVIARQAALFYATYGFYPTYEIAETDPSIPNLVKCSPGCSTAIELTNGGDELLLYDPAGDVVDALAWGNSPWGEFDPKIKPAAEGHTLERYPAYLDTDSASDWRSQSEPNPGRVNLTPPTLTPSPTLTPDPLSTPSPTITPPPFGGQLLISEVQADPLEAEPAGEWIELYNPSVADYSLSGFKLGDEETPGGSEGMLQFPVNALINAGQVLVIANQSNTFAAAHGFKPDYELSESDAAVPNLSKYATWGSGSVSLVNGGDEVLLLDGADHIVDIIAYGDSAYADFQPPVTAAPAGSSIERYPLTPDTNTAADWRIQAAPAPGQVDLSLPSTPTPTLTPTALPPLVINEIHADPHISAGDANGDGSVNTADDEFVEIVNTTNNPIDLSGWTLHDGTSLRHTFPISSVLPANCSVVVFGGGLLPGTYGGSLVYTATTKALGLNNTGDTLILFNASATTVISTTYGSEGGDDQALTRSPDILGLFIKHTLAAQSGGRRFSPGTHLDGTPFAGCGGLAQEPLRRDEWVLAWGILGLMALPGWWWRRRRC
jgi:hypothetical protein